MPAKMFVCKICHEEVSRKKSWASSEVGFGPDGRVCRHHEEVIETIAEREREAEQKKTINEAKLIMLKISLIEKIRFEEYERGGMKYPYLCYENLKHKHNLSDCDIAEIKAGVEKRGPLTGAEVLATLATFGNHLKREFT